MRGWAVFLGMALSLPLASGTGAHAQTQPAPAETVTRIFRPQAILRGPGGAPRPLAPGFLQIVTPPAEAPLAQQPWEPLPPRLQIQLQRARELRANGMLEAAQRQLVALLGGAPHHPQALAELAEVELARSAWAEVEKLARAERAPHRDSLLLARPLAVALERLGRNREAAQVAIEAWLASDRSEWAPETLQRLAPAEPAVREALRAAAGRAPSRSDLPLLLASLDWRSGAGPQALRSLAALDGPERRPPLRWSFADALLRGATARDSSGAVEALLAVAEDERFDALAFRVPAAQRAWDLLTARGAEVAAAPRVAHDLESLPIEQWKSDLLFAVTRALRRGGHTPEARALLARGGHGVDAGAAALERALADLRDGPPARALPGLHAAAPSSPEAAFRYAEALFFSGLSDSALACYRAVAKDPAGAWTGSALERMFLIEDANPAAALPALGRMAWEEWRGEPRNAIALAESLARTLPPGPTWAQAGLELSRLREAAGDARGALAPVLAIADSLPGDRLAPVARQRAGDLYLDRLHDERAAVAQYEECLARYPRAWNAAEVRRRLEALRRERRF